MKASCIPLACLGIFILCHLHVTSASYSMAQTCQYYSQGYIADPDNCQSYGYCSGGVLVGTQLCNKGDLYNSYAGKCQNGSTVICNTNINNLCLNVPEGQVVADPFDCARFCQCSGGTATCGTCGPKYIYNPSIAECDWPSAYSCPSSSICQLVPNNQFVGNPESCGQFIQCQQGTGSPGSCATGELFDPIRGGCSESYTCNGSNTPTDNTGAGPGVNSPLPNSATACSSYDTTGASVQYFADGKTCMGYYACSSAITTGKWAKCGMNLHFSAAEQACVNPLAVDCALDRCGNMQGNFMSQLGCKGYVVCANQTTTTKSTCSNAPYTFFDERIQACVDALPTYTICA